MIQSADIPLRGYAAALSAVALALLLNFLWPRTQPTVFPLFFAAVMFAAWYGGLGPGLLASALSCLAIHYFFIEPFRSFAVHSGIALRLVVFSLAACLISHLTAARRRAEEAIRETDRQLRLILESSGEGIYRVDREGRCTFINRAAAEMLGYRPEEVIDEHMHALVHHHRADGSRYPIKECPIYQAFRAGEGVRVDDEVLWRKDGTAFPAIYSSCPIRHGDTVEGAVMTFTDITDRRRVEEALREADRRKNDFLAMLAHELRNPLSAVDGAVQLLRRAEIDEESREWAVQVIGRQVGNLAGLIDDLLDASRIMQGKIRLERRVVDAAPILAHAVEVARPLIEERKHRLLASHPPGPLWVDVDPSRLEQVVVNLLTNAAKYTPSGGHLWLTAGSEGRSIVIAVRDDGIGIPPEQLPRMFKLFAQGERSLDRSEGGLGIGLTLVKTLVELHGGTVAARSDGDGKGSEFVVSLPAANAESANDATNRHSKVGQAGASRRILIVDDNADTALTTARLLRLDGHDVRVAHDGPDAIEAAQVHLPEIVLLDIGLPGMDGYEVAVRLRGEDLAGAVLVAVSGYGDEQARRRSREAGIDHHLVKPVDLDDLLEVIQSHEAPCRE